MAEPEELVDPDEVSGGLAAQLAQARAEVERLTVRLDDAEAERAEAVDAYLRAELAELTEMRRQRDAARAELATVTAERDLYRGRIAHAIAVDLAETRRERDAARRTIAWVAAYIRDRACAHLTMVPLVEVDQALRGTSFAALVAEQGTTGRVDPEDLAVPDLTEAERKALLAELDPPRPARRCNAQYPRRERSDRIVECGLQAGHPGEHEEDGTEITWGKAGESEA